MKKCCFSVTVYLSEHGTPHSIIKAVPSIDINNETKLTMFFSEIFKGAKYDFATCLYVVNHDRNSVSNRSKKRVICRQTNENLALVSISQ